MSAYLIVDTKLKNAEAYEEYKNLVKPLIEKFGGTHLVRGGALDIRETDLWTPTRVVIVEFPDIKSAQAFLDSDEYVPIKPIRDENAESTLFIVDGN